MKKFILSTLIAIITITSCINVYAYPWEDSQEGNNNNNLLEIVLRVDYIYYNNTTHTYNMKCIDENEEVWEIELLYKQKINRHFLQCLKKQYKNAWIVGIFLDEGTPNYIYDDEIIDWYMICPVKIKEESYDWEEEF